MRVRIYRNLTQGCLSIQAQTPNGWRVVAHASDVLLADVSFTVSQPIRERILRTKRKEVHAYAVGELVGWVGSQAKHATVIARRALAAAAEADLGDPPAWERVAYNPYRQETFHRVTGSPDREPPVTSCAELRAATTPDGVVMLARDPA